MIHKCLLGILCGLGLALFGCSNEKTGNVIFIHPDGTSAATWAAARMLYVGPDADLQWDLLPAMALYRGHMKDSLTATSNGGGTTHAYGKKVASNAYGKETGGPEGALMVDEEGHSLSVARQALKAGLQVALVQSGIATEPGTGCFLVSVDQRNQHDEIALQLLESGARILLSGGERYFLPRGEQGVHGAGVRQDGRNLIQEAKEAGFTVVRTREELLALNNDTEKVLGLFADAHTFNDVSEEELIATGKQAFDPAAPTIGEMTDVALRLLSSRSERFLLVVEEEATDNFGNKNNASGMLEAMRRSDEAIGVARSFVARHKNTLLITAADSDAGGMRVRGIVRSSSESPIQTTVPERGHNGAPLDGVSGTGSAPFLAQPDANGLQLPFWITWAATEDLSGGILVRGEGYKSDLIKGNMDNTEIAKLIRQVLFNK